MSVQLAVFRCLLIAHTLHLFLHIVEAEMGVCIQRNTDIRMSHDILQGLGIHAGLRHIGTECMSAHMGSDFRELHLVDAVIFFPNVLEVFFSVQSPHRHSILIQKQESCITVNHRLHFRFGPC